MRIAPGRAVEDSLWKPHVTFEEETVPHAQQDANREGGPDETREQPLRRDERRRHLRRCDDELGNMDSVGMRVSAGVMWLWGVVRV